MRAWNRACRWLPRTCFNRSLTARYEVLCNRETGHSTRGWQPISLLSFVLLSTCIKTAFRLTWFPRELAGHLTGFHAATVSECTPCGIRSTACLFTDVEGHRAGSLPAG